MRFAKWLLCAVGLVSLGFGVSIAAQGTKPQPEPDVLSALLVEVRGLRQAMEAIGSSGARVQLSLGRLQLQETRINNMIRRLESIRDARSKAERDNQSAMGQLANFQNIVKQQEKDVKPGEPNPFSSMLEGFKKGIEAGEAEVLRLQSEEAQLEQQIATEQARWGEINRALEELERALGRR